MSKSAIKRFSANEKEIAALLKENQEWKETISYAAEEINFLALFLKADLYKDEDPDLEETLEIFYSRLENYKTENLELTMEIHNHRYDIEGMMECEDIGCEVFYHEEHLKLKGHVKDFLERFRSLKLDIYSYTGKSLQKKRKPEEE